MNTDFGDLMPLNAATAHIAVPLLGASTGLRSFTPLAVTAWFAKTGKLPVEGTWASWIASPAALGLLTAAAVGEYVGDKLPNTPNRTAPLPLLGRLVCGGLVGAVVTTAYRRPLLDGIVFGALGAAAGAYGGFYVRRGLTRNAGWPDFPVGILGDILALVLAVRSLNRLNA